MNIGKVNWLWAAIGGVLFAIVVGAYRYAPDAASATIASWVQAGGSVIAIVAAGWIASAQFEWTKKREAEKEKRVHGESLNSLLHLLEQAKTRTRTIGQTIKPQRSSDLLPALDAEFETLIRAMERTDIGSFTFAELGPTIAGIAAARVFQRRVQFSMRQAMFSAEQLREQATEAAKELQDTIEDMGKLLADFHRPPEKRWL